MPIGASIGRSASSTGISLFKAVHAASSRCGLGAATAVAPVALLPGEHAEEDTSTLSEGLSPLLPETTTFTEADDVPYAGDRDPDHMMTVYARDGDGPFPASVVIHSGAWRAGAGITFGLRAADMHAEASLRSPSTISPLMRELLLKN